MDASSAGVFELEEEPQELVVQIADGRAELGRLQVAVDPRGHRSGSAATARSSASDGRMPRSASEARARCSVGVR
jgi:hypothetical protein